MNFRFTETGFHIKTVADHTCQGISRIKTRLYLTLAFSDGALQATPPYRKWRTNSWAAARGNTPNLFQLSWFVGSRTPVKTEHLKCLNGRHLFETLRFISGHFLRSASLEFKNSVLFVWMREIEDTPAQQRQISSEYLISQIWYLERNCKQINVSMARIIEILTHS